MGRSGGSSGGGGGHSSRRLWWRTFIRGIFRRRTFIRRKLWIIKEFRIWLKAEDLVDHIITVIIIIMEVHHIMVQGMDMVIVQEEQEE